MSTRDGSRLRTGVRIGLIAVPTLVFAFPFYLLISVSLKTTLEAFANPFSLPTSPNWGSYSDVLAGAGVGVDIVAALVNSVLITGVSCVLLVLIGSATAYTLARNPGVLSNVLYVFFVLGIIIPSQIGVVPLYSWLRELDLVGSALAMIVVYVLKQTPLAVFVFVGFFKRLPIGYEEAAAMDGAGRLTIFARVVMPQMKAVTGTALVLNAIYIWNDLFDQLVFLSGSRVLTLPVAIYSLTFTNVSRWNVIFAAVVISLVPMVLLYLFTQKKMMASLSGGLKG